MSYCFTEHLKALSHCGNSGEDKWSKGRHWNRHFVSSGNKCCQGIATVCGLLANHNCTEWRLIRPAAGIIFEKFIIVINNSIKGQKKVVLSIASQKHRGSQKLIVLYFENSSFKLWLFYKESFNYYYHANKVITFFHKLCSDRFSCLDFPLCSIYSKLTTCMECFPPTTLCSQITMFIFFVS